MLGYIVRRVLYAIPILIGVNLITFMLLSITGLATFGMLNVSAPKYSDGRPVAVADCCPERRSP